MTTSEIQQAATDYINAGFSVIPVLASKKSKGSWKEFQDHRLPLEDIQKKFNGSTHMAVIGGAVSGNLEILDIDDATIHEELFGMVKLKHKAILDKLVFTKTPRGFGIIYRCVSEVDSSLKLAMTHTEVEEAGIYTWNNRSDVEAVEVDGKFYIQACRAETRGRGGYSLVAPTPGYEVLEGSFEGLEPISAAERKSILDLARTYDERPVQFSSSVTKSTAYKPGKKKIPYPGDVFAAAANYPEMLEDHGWQKIGNIKGGTTWRRPGGTPKKISATLYEDGNLMVFSTNCQPLEAEKQYNAFAFYTAVEHGGNFSDSTKAVAEAGYVPSLSVDELKEILENNPDEIDSAYKRSGLTEADISQVVLDLGLEVPAGKGAGRRGILYDQLELSRVVTEMDLALSEVEGRWGYYWYADRIGYVTPGNTFTAYNVDNLELRAEDSFYTEQYGKKSRLEGIRAPAHCLTKLLTYPDTTAPKIKGFAKHPVLIDGEIAGLVDGFEKGVMFKDCTGFKVDERGYVECYNRIVELFCKDILFLDRVRGPALFVSMMLTAVARLGIEGGCPGYFITANEPGTGKSTMFEFVSRVVYGELVESVDWGTDSVERRKEIIANLREGQECFLFENIEQGEEIKSPILAQAITAGKFKARVMGKGEMVYVPAQSLFVFVGNNLTMSTELSRRLMTIELMAQTENPARRKVDIKNPTQYCIENRNEAMGCLLKMLKESVDMEDKLDQSSGFDFWDKMVRNPIFSEVQVDILHGFDESAASSEETASIGELIHSLRGVFGVGVENKFYTKDVFLAIADEFRLEDDEKRLAGEIRKGVEEECRQLRDGMILVNGRAADSLKSAGLVLVKLTNRISDEYRFVRNKTKSRTPVAHWIEFMEVLEVLDEGDGEG